MQQDPLCETTSGGTPRARGPPTPVLQGWGTGEGTTPGLGGKFFSFAGPLVA